MAPRHFEDFEGSTKFAKDKLWWLFKLLWRDHPIDDPITAAKIGDISGWEWVDDPDQPGGRKRLERAGLRGGEVRAMVHYYRTVHRFPIASCAKGYAWGRNAEEMTVTREHIEDRHNALADDLEAVNDPNFKATPFDYSQTPGQLTLGEGFEKPLETLGDIAHAGVMR